MPLHNLILLINHCPLGSLKTEKSYASSWLTETKQYDNGKNNNHQTHKILLLSPWDSFCLKSFYFCLDKILSQANVKEPATLSALYHHQLGACNLHLFHKE